MGRLIDADELHKMAKEPTIYDINVADVLSLINDCPTAYSVEAVVRELEELRNSTDNEYAQFCFERAIYAVKRGGRDE